MKNNRRGQKKKKKRLASEESQEVLCGGERVVALFPTVFLSDSVFCLFSPMRQPGPRLPQFENHTRFQTKLSKVYTRFLTKTAQKPYPLEERMG